MPQKRLFATETHQKRQQEERSKIDETGEGKEKEKSLEKLPLKSTAILGAFSTQKVVRVSPMER